jgi:site-specific recombinase XerD
MASAKFYLEKRRNTTGEIRIDKVPIYLFFSFNGKRFQHYTGERIDAKYWDDKKQRVKPNYPGTFEINAILEHLSEKAYRFYRQKRLAGNIPTVEDFKNEFSGAAPQIQSRNIFSFYQEYIDSKKISASWNSVKKYQTNLTHLREFALARKFSVEFDSINDSFFDKYLNFFIYDLEHTNNTISRNIRILKTFLNWATKRGYNTNLAFRNFTYKGFDGEIIYLTMDELMHLYSMDIQNEKLSKVRDIFCFGCFTGLRYSDIQNLKKEDVRGDFIRSFSIKTKDQLCIPLNEYSKALIDKYSQYPIDFCFPAPSNQKMNDYLKELGELAGFKEEINLVSFRGSDRIEIKYYKYQLLTTHVARKTFVTNAHQKGISTETIMKITNHKNHQTVARYLKIEEKQMHDAMQKIF